MFRVTPTAEAGPLGVRASAGFVYKTRVLNAGSLAGLCIHIIFDDYDACQKEKRCEDECENFHPRTIHSGHLSYRGETALSFGFVIFNKDHVVKI